MTFSTTFQFFYGDDAGRQKWLLDHYLEHKLFYTTLLSNTVITTILPIQKMENPQSPADWLNAHQRVSQSVWTGIGGGQMIDLERVDWSNASMLQSWLERHGRWHAEVRNVLSL